MNKDIQTLIEREAENYADSKGIYNQHGEDLLKMGFNKGAHFAFSLFKWRKVSDELPDVEVKVIVKTTNGNYVISEMYIPKDCHGTVLGCKEWKGSHSFKMSITEWMPISQID